jgi:predicted MPP superfamily phosphohydrolase
MHSRLVLVCLLLGVMCRFIHALQILQQATRSVPRPVLHTPVDKELRVWSLSDLHCDNHSNLRWIEAWPTQKTQSARNVLIVAGDISSKLDVLQKTLAVLQTKYDEVLFVPGNHELWVSSRIAKLERCSIQKFLDVMALCKVHFLY